MAKKRKDIIDSKDVLIISFSDVNDIDNGFTYTNSKNIYSKFNDGKFVSHCNLDECIEVTQIVPFLMICNEKNEYLVMKRNDAPINKPSDLYSIGLYDHIYSDDGYSDPLFSSLARLLYTNLIKYKPLPFKHIGYVKDIEKKGNHLGVVFVLNTLSSTIEPCNKRYAFEWFSKEKLIDNWSRFKPWSQHIINFIIDSELEEDI